MLLLVGVSVLAASVVVMGDGENEWNFMLGMIMQGIGWNFGVGTVMLTGAYRVSVHKSECLLDFRMYNTLRMA